MTSHDQRNKLRFTHFSVAVGAMMLAASCTREDPMAPPVVFIGSDVCSHCGMIISDARFTSALVVNDSSPVTGTTKLIFDDIGDMLDYQRKHSPDTQRMYVRDHISESWMPAMGAFFIQSDMLSTPMASGVAAFETRSAAENALKSTPGGIFTWEQLVAARSAQARIP